MLLYVSEELCLLLLLLLRVKSYACSVCRLVAWDSTNARAPCCKNALEEVGVFFKINYYLMECKLLLRAFGRQIRTSGAFQ